MPGLREEEQDTEETSSAIRSALEGAFDGSEEAPAPQVEPLEEETPQDDAPAIEGGKPRDPKGRFAKGAQTEENPLQREKAPEGQQTPQAQPQQGKQAPQGTQTPEKAPQSWKPTAREKFAALDPEVKAEVLRREREQAVLVQQTSGLRKFTQDFQSVVSPYAAMIEAEGSNPLVAMGKLFQTAAALRTAPGHIKAKLVADMVRTFNIPLDHLASHFGGEQPQVQPQQQFQDPRLDSLLQELGQAKQARVQQARQQGFSEVEAFIAKTEFAEDVREDMAAFIEAAHARGVDMSLEDAYARAVQLHPGIAQVLQQREAAKRAGNPRGSTRRAQVASSSIRPEHSSSPRNSLPVDGEDLRATIEAAAGRR
jgi:hypothetical protein